MVSEPEDAGEPLVESRVAPPSVARIQLRGWTFVLTALTMGFIAYAQVMARGGHVTPYQLGYIAGSWFAMLVLAGLLGLLAFVASRRSVLAFNIVFAAVVALFLAREGVQHGRRIQQAKANLELKIQSESLKKELAASQAQGDPSDVRGQSARVADILEKSASKVGGDPAIYARILADFSRELGTKIQRYADGMKAFHDAGSIDPASIRDREDLRGRITALQVTSKHNDEAEAFMIATRDDLPARLRAAGVATDKAEESSRLFGRKLEPGLRLRRIQREGCQAMLEYLGFLDQHWGSWAIDEATGLVEFDTAEQGDALTAIAQRIEALGDQEAALLEALSVER